MTDKQKLGKAGEDAAARHIQKNGMKLLARNYRAGKGEIDLIALDSDTLVFIEVKTRTGTAYGTAAEAVGYRKQQMIIRTAQYFIAQRKLHECAVRFDVAEVYSEEENEYRVQYIRDAFTL